jgi:hypothetical protein
MVASRRFSSVLIAACIAWICLSAAARPVNAARRVGLVLDSSEADQALQILDKEHEGRRVDAADWARLFAAQPYQWLKGREASLGRGFTDDQFKQFLESREAQASRAVWRRTLAGMKRADMVAIGKHVLAWLPPGAALHARVFPEIKPLKNSFVWSKEGEGPAIFLAIQEQSPDSFENTVAHELHHIGLESLAARQQALQAPLPERVKRAMTWMGAFGEGEAMLAAVGSNQRHPHWEDDALTRARWDSDMMHFNSDLTAVQQLLLDILDGKLTDQTEIRKRAAPFWGVQGAWYTVGYEMAVLVEKRYGRAAFNDCLLDPRLLLVRYNEVAREANAAGASLATWSPELLEKLKAPDGSALGRTG